MTHLSDVKVDSYRFKMIFFLSKRFAKFLQYFGQFFAILWPNFNNILAKRLQYFGKSLVVKSFYSIRDIE